MLKEALLILFSGLGLFISFHIWNKIHNQKKKLVCMIGDGDCDKVVKSKYNHILGMDNSVMGMFYYVFILALVSLKIFYPYLFALSFIAIGEKAIIGFAAAFSVVLTFIQLSVIKKACEYCMIANAVNILIFLTVIFL